jgi:hypothetical protein
MDSVTGANSIQIVTKESAKAGLTDEEIMSMEGDHCATVKSLHKDPRSTAVWKAIWRVYGGASGKSLVRSMTHDD